MRPELTARQIAVLEALRADHTRRAIYRGLYGRAQAGSLYAQLQALAAARLPDAAAGAATIVVGLLVPAWLVALAPLTS